MATTGAATRAAARRPRSVDVQEVPAYCSRPSCRAEYVKTIGPGRPQAFCSELCRRAAERELRQVRSQLAHFRAMVEQLQIDEAAFGRATADEGGLDDERGARRAAEEAVARVGGVLAFLGESADPVARELRALHEAVAPVILDVRGG